MTIFNKTGASSFFQKQLEEFVQDIHNIKGWIETGMARYVGRPMDNYTCAEMRDIVDNANRSIQDKWQCHCHFSISGADEHRCMRPGAGTHAPAPTTFRELLRWLEEVSTPRPRDPNYPTGDVEVSLNICPGHQRLIKQIRANT